MNENTVFIEHTGLSISFNRMLIAFGSNGLSGQIRFHAMRFEHCLRMILFPELCLAAAIL